MRTRRGGTAGAGGEGPPHAAGGDGLGALSTQTGPERGGLAASPTSPRDAAADKKAPRQSAGHHTPLAPTTTAGPKRSEGGRPGPRATGAGYGSGARDGRATARIAPRPLRAEPSST